MGKVWTLGIIWGMFAWVPFFIKTPLILEVTLGLPVIIAGYGLLLLEMMIGVVPNGVGFCLSLPAGVGICWLFHGVLTLGRRQSGQKMERGVE